MKKTPWFSVKTKPVRAGIYEFRWPTIDALKAYWDGRYWFGRFADGSLSYFSFHLLGDEEWRGRFMPSLEGQAGARRHESLPIRINKRKA